VSLLEVRRASLPASSPDVVRPATDPASNAQRSGHLILIDATDQVALRADGAFVVCVEFPGGRYVRRCFFTLIAAQRAARNARKVGRDIHVYLCSLNVLGEIPGGDL
jgi:hypothetical protein